MKLLSVHDDLFIGGYRNSSAIVRLTGVLQQQGLVGCVRRVVINGQLLDLRREPSVGDAIYGYGIGQLFHLENTTTRLDSVYLQTDAVVV